MAIDYDIAFLERVPTLGPLGRPALRILAIGVETRHVDGGEVLFNAGDEAEGGFVVQASIEEKTASDRPTLSDTNVSNLRSLSALTPIGAAITLAIFCFPWRANCRYELSAASERCDRFPNQDATDDKSRRHRRRSRASDAG